MLKKLSYVGMTFFLLGGAASSEPLHQFECPFLVNGVVVLQPLPNHYPATVSPDVDDTDENGSGRVEWNNLDRTRLLFKSPLPLIAECTPAYKEGERAPAGTNVEIPNNVTRCVMENANKLPTRFWCD